MSRDGLTSMTPADRIDALRDEIRHHEERYYIHNDPEISDDAFDRAAARARARSRREHPDLVTPDSPTQRVAGRPVEGFQTVEHLAPMLSLDNAYNDDELRAFDERVRKGAGLGDGAGAVRRRAEDRRPEHRADLRGRAARPRRHARRRRCAARTSPPTSARSGAIPLRLRGGPAGADRSARRGLPAARVVRAHQPRARGRRRAALRQSRATPPPGRCGISIPALVASRGLAAFVYQLVGPTDGAPADALTETAVGACARGGCRSSRTGGAATASTPSSRSAASGPTKRHALEFDTDGVVVKVDDLALRERLGSDREVSALGDGVQVPGAAGARRSCCGST